MGTISPDIEVGQMIASPIITCFVLFAGIFINASSLPEGSEWVAEISFVKWGFQAFCILEFKDRQYEITNDGKTMIYYGNNILEEYGL